MIELVDKMQGRLKLLAISQDSSREEIDAFLKAFPQSKNPNVILLWDKDSMVAKQFNVDRLPESYVANANHQLVRKIVGSIKWSTPEAISFMEEIVKSPKDSANQ